jgi:hypothetical protein
MSEIDLEAIKARADAVAVWVDSAWPVIDRKASVRMLATGDVPALLARVAELKAEIREGRARFQVLVDQHRADLDATNAAAERRGYERAVARLRDGEAWERFLTTAGDVTYASPDNEFAADYLDAVKGDTDD